MPDPELVRQVTVVQTAAFCNRDDSASSTDGGGLVTAQSDTHAALRGALNPLFLQPASLEAYAPLIANEAAAMVRSWGPGGVRGALSPAGAGALAESLNKWALNCLFRITFGDTAVEYAKGVAVAPRRPRTKLPSQRQIVLRRLGVDRLQKGLRQFRHWILLSVAAARVHSYQLTESLLSGSSRRTFMDFTKAYTNRDRQLVKARQQLQHDARRAKDRRQGTNAASWQQRSSALVADRVAAFRAGGGAGEGVLGSLLRSGTVSDAQLSPVVRDVLIAGSETAASTAAVTLWEILQSDAGVRATLEAEIAVLDGAPPTYDQAQKALPFVTACVREALRLHTSSPIVFRMANRQVNLGGFSIPAGSGMVMSTAWLGRDPQQWSRPHTFLPQRHVSKSGPLADEGRHSFSWLPFGAGPHACLGSKLGILEAVIVVTTILQAQKLQLDAAAGTQDRSAVGARTPLTDVIA
eukprot:TRINITY_DN782_c0_g1_i3.p1 TRINITY_DN782_c0_g1~~TRINITY_DN782_c0_g1_i3.p1  ORF type:complete len:466 (-),score=121.83 TRINITY_DN782_c0_g1_i3:417-1814(-)